MARGEAQAEKADLPAANVNGIPSKILPARVAWKCTVCSFCLLQPVVAVRSLWPVVMESPS